MDVDVDASELIGDDTHMYSRRARGSELRGLNDGISIDTNTMEYGASCSRYSTDTDGT